MGSKRRSNTFTSFFEDIVDNTKDLVDDLVDRAKDVEENTKDAIVDVTEDEKAEESSDMAALNRTLQELQAKVAELAAVQGKKS